MIKECLPEDEKNMHKSRGWDWFQYQDSMSKYRLSIVCHLEFFLSVLDISKVENIQQCNFYSVKKNLLKGSFKLIMC